MNENRFKQKDVWPFHLSVKPQQFRCMACQGIFEHADGQVVPPEDIGLPADSADGVVICSECADTVKAAV